MLTTKKGHNVHQGGQVLYFEIGTRSRWLSCFIYWKMDKINSSGKDCKVV